MHSEEIVNNNPDQYKAFLEVKAIGDNLVKTEFAHVRTDYEDILFIPAARKGKMKMKTKGAAERGLEEDYANESDVDHDVELMTDDDFEDINSSDVEIDLNLSGLDQSPKIVSNESSQTIKKPKKAAKVKVSKNNIKNNKKAKPVSKKVKVMVKIKNNKGKSKKRKK